MKTIATLTTIPVICSVAHSNGGNDLSDERKAQIKASIEIKLTALSPEAQSVGKQLFADVDANKGNDEAIKNAAIKILEKVPDSVKKELLTAVPNATAVKMQEKKTLV